MRKVQSTLPALVLAAAVAGGGFAFFASPLVPTAQARWHDHPKLETAYGSLKEAKAYLENAPHDFHGHKVEAIKAIDAAMHQLRECAEEREPTPGEENAPLEEHPRLHEAREHLKAARAYLDEAPHDFHGHKREAIAAVDEAIHQIDKCLE